jgi:hypothetical protein
MSGATLLAGRLTAASVVSEARLPSNIRFEKYAHTSGDKLSCLAGVPARNSAMIHDV